MYTPYRTSCHWSETWHGHGSRMWKCPVSVYLVDHRVEPQRGADDKVGRDERAERHGRQRRRHRHGVTLGPGLAVVEAVAPPEDGFGSGHGHCKCESCWVDIWNDQCVIMLIWTFSHVILSFVQQINYLKLHAILRYFHHLTQSLARSQRAASTNDFWKSGFIFVRVLFQDEELLPLQYYLHIYFLSSLVTLVTLSILYYLFSVNYM